MTIRITEDCEHVWIPNSGQDGEPVFTLNRQMGPYPLMHVKCSKCNCRTWYTEEQWREIPVAEEFINAH